MWNYLLTCEHASHRIPRRFAARFAGAEDVLRSHRGWDPGTKAWAQFIARKLHAPCLATDFSRLLIEPNRTLRHPALFSEFTRGCSREEKQVLIQNYYLPHWNRIIGWLEQQLQKGRSRIIHLGIHSFTPQLNGHERNAEIGLLYDPHRVLEQSLCKAWQDSFRELRPDLRIRRNYPYKGSSDGLTTALRRRFPDNRYVGIEVEFNQALCAWSYRERMQIASDLIETMHGAQRRLRRTTVPVRSAPMLQ